MSQYYKGKRSRNVFDPTSREPFKISRSKIELFLECPRCFYLDRRLGVGRPPGFPFSLNAAVDALLKKEFDIHRVNKTIHPLMKAYGIDAIPFNHKDLAIWRENFKGVQYLEPKTNLIITGAIDDVWCGPDGKIMVVDYKATSKNEEVNLDADWQMGYKRQMEMYQWLMRKNGFNISDTGYFVYVNGKTDVAAFDGKLEFDVKIIHYQGSDKWVDGAIADLHKCLIGDKVPAASSGCDYCSYREEVDKALE